jgi:hypothetical protein
MFWNNNFIMDINSFLDYIYSLRKYFMDNVKYQGVILGKQKTDWILGANSPLDLKVRTNGNWKSYSSEHEIQIYNVGYNDSYDTSLCTQYASTDVIEHIVNWDLENNKVPATIKNWLDQEGYLVNGRLEISERLGGANSDMTPSGTYLFKAADAIRNLGIVPQSRLPLANNFNDNINPNLIPEEIYALGRKSKEYIMINWNWVDRSQVSEVLKDSPLLATVKFANGDGILKPNGIHNHAIMVAGEESDHYIIDDSYFEQYKKYDKDYVDNFLQFSITYNITNMNTNEFISKNDTRIIRNINTGAYAVIYAGNFLKITEARAGLFSVDRIARRINEQGVVPVNNEEWTLLDKENKYF